MFRASRDTPPGVDPYLDIRIGLFVIGAILGVTGMVVQVPVVISFGVLALAIGMILGFIGKRARREGAHHRDTESTEGSEEEPKG